VAGVWSQAVGFALVRLAGNIFTFNLLCKENVKIVCLQCD
jgi:hypothetical protein